MSQAKLIMLLTVVVVLAVSGLIVWVAARLAGPRAMGIKVSGPAGVKVSATLDVDGRTYTEEKNLPCEFTATGRKLLFKIKILGDADGLVRFEMFAGGRPSSSVGGDLRGASGYLEFEGWGVKRASISGE